MLKDIDGYLDLIKENGSTVFAMCRVLYANTYLVLRTCPCHGPHRTVLGSLCKATRKGTSRRQGNPRLRIFL